MMYYSKKSANKALQKDPHRAVVFSILLSHNGLGVILPVVRQQAGPLMAGVISIIALL